MSDGEEIDIAGNWLLLLADLVLFGLLAFMALGVAVYCLEHVIQL